MPSSSMTRIVEACTVSPRKSRRKSWCFSRTTTSMPARARSKPSIMPAGPPPTMAQVVSVVARCIDHPYGVSVVMGLVGENPPEGLRPPPLGRLLGVALAVEITCNHSGGVVLVRARIPSRQELGNLPRPSHSVEIAEAARGHPSSRPMNAYDCEPNACPPLPDEGVGILLHLELLGLLGPRASVAPRIGGRHETTLRLDHRMTVDHDGRISSDHSPRRLTPGISARIHRDAIGDSRLGTQLARDLTSALVPNLLQEEDIRSVGNAGKQALNENLDLPQATEIVSTKGLLQVGRHNQYLR